MGSNYLPQVQAKKNLSNLTYLHISLCISRFIQALYQLSLEYSPCNGPFQPPWQARWRPSAHHFNQSPGFGPNAFPTLIYSNFIFCSEEVGGGTGIFFALCGKLIYILQNCSKILHTYYSSFFCMPAVFFLQLSQLSCRIGHLFSCCTGYYLLTLPLISSISLYKWSEFRERLRVWLCRVKLLPRIKAGDIIIISEVHLFSESGKPHLILQILPLQAGNLEM